MNFVYHMYLAPPKCTGESQQGPSINYVTPEGEGDSAQVLLSVPAGAGGQVKCYVTVLSFVTMSWG